MRFTIAIITTDIYNGSNTQITINPYSGFAIGSYPLYTDDKYTINENNAKFWVDTDGNVHLKGTLHGVDGTFSGELQAATGRFKGIVQASDFQDLSGKSMINSDYQFKPDYLNLKGLTISNGSRTTLEIDSNGNISMQGNITMTGGNISWSNINETGSAAYQTANSAYNLADDAYDAASSAADNVRKLANGQYSGTFISGREIVSPKIKTNLLTVTIPNAGELVEDNDEDGYGILMKGYYRNNAYKWLKIYYYEGDFPYLHFDSPDNATVYWDFTTTHFAGNTYFSRNVAFTGNVNFSGANVSGLNNTATFG